jgi:hypothetical protein
MMYGAIVSGGSNGGETPVPIPNTAVKPSRADDSIYCESRPLPVYQRTRFKGGFFV